MIVNEIPEIQHRGCYIMINLLDLGKESSEKLLEGQMLEILMAVTILNDPERQRAKKLCDEALKKAEKYGIIKQAK